MDGIASARQSGSRCSGTKDRVIQSWVASNDATSLVLERRVAQAINRANVSFWALSSGPDAQCSELEGCEERSALFAAKGLDPDRGSFPRRNDQPLLPCATRRAIFIFGFRQLRTGRLANTEGVQDSFPVRSGVRHPQESSLSSKTFALLHSDWLLSLPARWVNPREPRLAAWRELRSTSGN